MQEPEFNQELLRFIQTSPTPFHAVSNMEARLQQEGFVRLQESDVWQLQTPGRYFVNRNGSSLIAFSLGQSGVVDSGIRMVGAHTDSPCLKIKPQPEFSKQSYYQLGVEVYGGVLLNPWFDRDLSIAGRVTYLAQDESIKNALIDFQEPIAVIPSLAIHLDREVNQNHSINAQKDLPPVLMQYEGDKPQDFRELLQKRMEKAGAANDIQQILDYELCLYDTQAPAIIGLHQDFIAAARLDNLLSCFVGMMSLLQTGKDTNGLLVCNDHEEVGSASASGAQGPFLKSVLQRLTGSAEAFSRSIDRSLMISADNAHGIHPNYSDKHDANHGPILNQGPVIKINANQRYATNSETAAVFRQLCRQADVSVQSFVVRSDMACGSTIGPITASEIGIKTLDVGVATFAMHSIRELAGARDPHNLYKVLSQFYRS